MSSVTEKWTKLRAAETPPKPPKSPIDFTTVLQLSTLPKSEADVIAANHAGAARVEEFRLRITTAHSDEERQAAHKLVADELKRLAPWTDKERAARRAGLLSLFARCEHIRALWFATATRWTELERLRERGAWGPSECAEADKLRLERETLYALVAKLKKIPQELRSLVPNEIGEALRQFEDAKSWAGRRPSLPADAAMDAKLAGVCQYATARHQQLADAALTLSWDELSKMAQTNE